MATLTLNSGGGDLGVLACHSAFTQCAQSFKVLVVEVLCGVTLHEKVDIKRSALIH